MIRLRDVVFRWRDGLDPVLDIPAFDVAAGERVFVRGASGSGKTTLLNLLGGVTVPERGSVAVGDQDLTAIAGARRDAFRADRIGFIFQMFNLVPYLSLVENVVLPCRFSAQRRARAGEPKAAARALLARMGLEPEVMAGRPVHELSVGQQQRVAAARALIGAPDLLVADEPTSALDADARGAFLDLLFAEARAAGATIVFVSHDGGIADRFDRRVDIGEINRAGRGEVVS